jgi:hypothetical protein
MAIILIGQFKQEVFYLNNFLKILRCLTFGNVYMHCMMNICRNVFIGTSQIICRQFRTWEVWRLKQFQMIGVEYRDNIGVYNPRADGAKRRARVLIPPGYLHPGKRKH